MTHMPPEQAQLLDELRRLRARVEELGAVDLERRRSESALRDSVETFSTAFYSNPIAMVIFNHTEGRIAEANEAMSRLTGFTREELLGRTSPQAGLGNAQDAAEVRSQLDRTGELRDMELAVTNRLGETRTCIFAAEMVQLGGVPHVLASAENITERKKSEEELARYREQLEELVEQRTRELAESQERARRAERLASIGTLAAGIAHEINNPLGSILLSADEALRYIKDPEVSTDALQQIKQDVKRCSHIVRNVLSFAKEQKTEKWACDLNEIIHNAVDMTRSYASSRCVKVAEELESAPVLLMACQTDMEQVFVNLIHNAVNASYSGGMVTLESAILENSEVAASITDEGRGMTPEQIERAFDPFYTTRQEEGGTGLGLSTVHGIVTDHGGSVDISSEPGRGTRFNLTFPKASNAESTHGENPGSG